MVADLTARARRELISERVTAHGEVSLARLAEEFAVSVMTIRRDFDTLEEEGVLRKVLGGAIAPAGKASEPPFHARAAESAEEKAHLARTVVALLKPRQTVILDSGSTVLAVARELRGKQLALTVVTPSLAVALELADEPETTVLVTGGLLRSGELSLIGSEAEDAFRRYNGDVYVMGVAGLDGVRGASDYHREEGAVKRQAVRAADRVIVVLDRSKLGRAQLMNVATVAEISDVVTDADRGHPVLQQLAAAGARVHSATG